MIKAIDDEQVSLPQYSPVCSKCKHARLEFRRCEAFGDKDIPLEIWEGKNNHRKPYPGDHGIQYKGREDAS